MRDALGRNRSRVGSKEPAFRNKSIMNAFGRQRFNQKSNERKRDAFGINTSRVGNKYSARMRNTSIVLFGRESLE